MDIFPQQSTVRSSSPGRERSNATRAAAVGIPNIGISHDSSNGHDLTNKINWIGIINQMNHEILVVHHLICHDLNHDLNHEPWWISEFLVVIGGIFDDIGRFWVPAELDPFAISYTLHQHVWKWGYSSILRPCRTRGHDHELHQLHFELIWINMN